MKSILFLLSLITLGAASAAADDAKPADDAKAPEGAFVDKLTREGNVAINTPGNVSLTFAPEGMTLTVTMGAGTEWYWSNGGNVSYNNNNNQAFPLDPAGKQSKLVIKVASITPGATLKVGAFYFAGGVLIDGKNQLLGEDTGGMNITAPGTYEFDVNAAAKTANITGATNWKADFWFTPDGVPGQAITISSMAASTGTSTPSTTSSSP